MNTIEVRGASVHNLKNVDLSIPKNQLIVFTGVSGSGKSSLLFDTILKESQRRFFETLSSYTKGFLDVSSKPQVRKIEGLSPSLFLAQNETKPSPRATIATLTSINELLGVLLSLEAIAYCPKHHLSTVPKNVEEWSAHLLKEKPTILGKVLHFYAPLVFEKKGAFKQVLLDTVKKGFVKAYIDGHVMPLTPLPQLDKDKKHTVKILIDSIRVSESHDKRIKKAMETSWGLSDGVCEWILEEAPSSLSKNHQFIPMSRHSGCPSCGYSLPKFDPRWFSPNGIKRCASCDGRGVEDDEKDRHIFVQKACKNCRGVGIDPMMEHVRFAEKSVIHLLEGTILDLHKSLLAWMELKLKASSKRVMEELITMTQSLMECGLGELQLSRRIESLSFGESQRLRLALSLGSQLRGVLYVLDEPSQGLHETEVQSLLEKLKKLVERKNTVCVVDHDITLMKGADLIVELGPEGGREGGHICALFHPKEAHLFTHASKIAPYLCDPTPTQTSKDTLEPSHQDPKLMRRSKEVDDPAQGLALKNINFLNLKIRSSLIPLGALTTVHGVSGSGKTNLLIRALYASYLSRSTEDSNGLPFDIQFPEGMKIMMVDRSPIGKTSSSHVSSYLKIFSLIRDLFAETQEAKMRGLRAADFGTHKEGGRCPQCQGKGYEVLSMKFLEDVEALCSLCEGKRYRKPILECRYKNQTIHDVLNMSIKDALDFFSVHKKIRVPLKNAEDLGLGYLTLGQTTQSLSGGESQRIKLAPYLTPLQRWTDEDAPTPSRAVGKASSIMLILDEPTTGLHQEDVNVLFHVLKKYTEMGATVVVAENHPTFVKGADYLVEMGPGSGEKGGQVISEGWLNS